jgi:hypothetical protein
MTTASLQSPQLIQQLWTTSQAAEYLRLSLRTLMRHRNEGVHIEGIHYTRLSGSRSIRYRPHILEHWALNRHNSAEHTKFCERELRRSRR